MTKREEYIEKLNTQLKKWDEEIDKLEGKAGEFGAEAKDKYREQMQALRAQRDVAMKKMQELGAASESAWQQMATGMNQAWEAMKTAMEKAAASFTKKS
jgi:uncharacterized coiled-coil DUF342 family protein